MKNKFYLTTPIYYVNDMPHLGHAYTTIMADVIKRYKQLRGFDAFLLTGTDEHGQKIEKSAAQMGLSPQQLADKVVERHKQLWQTLDISYDHFIRTTDDYHVQGVKKIFERIRAQGDIYPGEYEGFYCVSCESYVTGGHGVEESEERSCSDCGKTVSKITEKCYFFRLSAYQEKLLEFYEKNPDFVIPKTRMNEVVSFVKMGLKDLSITRSTVKWGVPVPGDENQTIYVWFDALSNYLTAVHYLQEDRIFQRFWPADLHIMAKDILKFHAVYWPAFLMAAGLEPPRKELIHGWWLKDEKKMSKSTGNVLNPQILLKHFSSDAIRYFMMREAPIGADGNFSHEGFIQRVTSDLTNDWANLVSRTTGMIEKYFAGSLPQKTTCGKRETQIKEEYLALEKRVLEYFDQYLFNRGLEEIFCFINRLNRYIVEVQPWSLAKEETSRGQLAGVLKTLIQAILALNTLLAPVLPKSAEKIRALFNHPGSKPGWLKLSKALIINKGEQLFPRVELQDFFADMEAPAQSALADNSEKEEDVITIDDFRKVSMVTALIRKAEKVENTDKLLKLEVDCGEDVRTLVAGIAQQYKPEALVGKKVIIVKNLQPATVRGVLSQGMILAAAGPDGRPYLPFLPEDTPIGSILK